MEKSGAWFSYKGERIGQGRENGKQFLKENKDIMAKIFLLKVQERTRGLLVTPELAAILISVLVLITAVVRPASTILIGTAI